MGQNNDPTERGDLQGQQGGKQNLPPSERKRQSGYPALPEGSAPDRAKQPMPGNALSDPKPRTKP